MKKPYAHILLTAFSPAPASQVVLLSSENLTGDSKQIIELIRGAITALRANPHYRHAPIIAIPEGMSNDAWYWHDLVFSRQPNICTMCECGTDAHGRRFGVPKNKQITTEMRGAMSMLLSTGQIAFEKDMIAISSSFVQTRHDEAALQSMLVQQLREHREDSDSNKSHGRNDLVITAMMVPYWMNRFTQSGNPGYEPFKKGLYNLMDMWLPVE